MDARLMSGHEGHIQPLIVAFEEAKAHGAEAMRPGRACQKAPSRCADRFAATIRGSVPPSNFILAAKTAGHIHEARLKVGSILKEIEKTPASKNISISIEIWNVKMT
ncbi:MAG: hypothetical protein LBP92_13095 [Deltaproteobacteria bacterium]|jgi:hypothetical protein|nr:hypothetical protein [Deltaproteobacteria bacterium]